VLDLIEALFFYGTGIVVAAYRPPRPATTRPQPGDSR
jgi:hypothetical protein